LKTKAGATHHICSEMLKPVQYLFQAFNSLIRSFTGSISLYFQAGP